MAPRQKVDIPVQRKIRALALQGFGAAVIERELRKDEDIAGRLPTLRTVQRYVAELTPTEKSGDWSLVDSEPEYVGTILEVLAAAIRRTGGQKRSLTKTEADWILIVRSAAPDLPAREVYPLARLYLLRQERNESTLDLDSLLAFAPWRGPSAMTLYRAAVTANQIPWPDIFWAMTTPYNRMLHDMGFDDALIEEAQGDYQKLMDLTRQFEVTGG